MKVREGQKAEKAQEIQAVAKTAANSKSAANGAREAILNQEFSDLMDKIAGQLQSAQQAADLTGLSESLRAEKPSKTEQPVKRPEIRQADSDTTKSQARDSQENDSRSGKTAEAKPLDPKKIDKHDKPKVDKKSEEKESTQSESQASGSAAEVSDASAPVATQEQTAATDNSGTDQNPVQQDSGEQGANQGEEQAPHQLNNQMAVQDNLVSQVAAAVVSSEPQADQNAVSAPNATLAPKQMTQASAPAQVQDRVSNVPVQTQSGDTPLAVKDNSEVLTQSMKVIEAQAPIIKNDQTQQVAVAEQTPVVQAQAVAVAAQIDAAVENTVAEPSVEIEQTAPVAVQGATKPVSQQSILLDQLLNRVSVAQRDTQAAQDREMISALRDATISPLILKSSMESALVKGLDLGKAGLESKSPLGINATSSDAVDASSVRQVEASVRAEAGRIIRPLPRLAEVRTMEKVENALKEAAKSRDGKTISLRLDPPSLGSVKVDVTIRDHALHARIIGESPEVNNLLRERAPELQAMLRKLGLNVDKVNVSVSGDDNRRQQASFEGRGFGADNRGAQRSHAGSVGVLNPDASAKIANTNEVMDYWVA